MMDGPGPRDTIPAEWSNIKFGAIDVLVLAPLDLQDPHTGSFGIIPGLLTRFNWALKTARAAPRLTAGTHIKIIVSQFWGSDPQGWGHPLTALPADKVDAYAKSIREFIVKYNLDGYDVDYKVGTIVPTIPAIYATVRAQLDGLSHAKGGRHYYTTVSPANLQYLQDAVGHISGVNMQTYSGGQGLTVKDFLGVGFGVDQLLYGVNSETPSEGPTVSQAVGEYNDYKLAGIHNWRVNSGDLLQENAWQEQIYRSLHNLK